MISLELSMIQQKEADRQMIRDLMAEYTGAITIVAPQPETDDLAEWRGVNQIAMPVGRGVE